MEWFEQSYTEDCINDNLFNNCSGVGQVNRCDCQTYMGDVAHDCNAWNGEATCEWEQNQCLNVSDYEAAHLCMSSFATLPNQTQYACSCMDFNDNHVIDNYDFYKLQAFVEEHLPEVNCSVVLSTKPKLTEYIYVG